MKITIDTKEDTHEEIRKAIRMLSTIVGDEHIYTNAPPKAPVANIFESSSNTIEPSTPSTPSTSSTPSTPSTSEPAQGNIFGNMFGDTDTPSSDSSSTETSEEKTEEKEESESPQVIVEY